MTREPRITCDPADLPAPANCAAPDPASDKAALRRQLLALRRRLDASQKAEWDGRIGEHVLAWWKASPVASLGVYWPLRGEPDLGAAYAQLAALGVQLALPVVLKRDAALGFAQWCPGEDMVQDAMGVAIPARLRLQACPAALVIPCLGFNQQRFRLGYGAGYYDRTLAQAPRPFTLGVAYSCLEARFDSAAHDIALELIITEAGAA